MIIYDYFFHFLFILVLFETFTFEFYHFRNILKFNHLKAFKKACYNFLITILFNIYSCKYQHYRYFCVRRVFIAGKGVNRIYICV